MPRSALLALRIVFAANVIVAGTVGTLTLFAPAFAARTVFDGTVEPSPALRIVGSFWLAIAITSAAGLRWPQPMAAVLLIQLLYKGMWLVCVALPAAATGDTARLPLGITAFFAAWVILLPFVIPWRVLFQTARD